MTEPVEVAIEMALVARAEALATAQGLAIDLPNVAFPGQNPDGTNKVTPSAYLRVNFLPAPTAGLGVNVNSHNQHYGILQIDAVNAQGVGEYAVARVAAAIIEYFKFETKVSNSGFTAMVWKPPYRGSMLTDAPTVFIPVSIPYVAFAANPA